MSLNYGDGASDPANQQIGHDLQTGGFNAYEMQYLPLHADFGAGMGVSPGMPGGGALGGLVRGMASPVRPGFDGFAQAYSPASISKHAVPGNAFPQMAPNTPAGLSVAGTENMPTPANQSATVTTNTSPTGADWRAGPPVKNNYSNLNGLKNRAYGVNYG